MTLQLLHSEFPYIWGKFDFFYQCNSPLVGKAFTFSLPSARINRRRKTRRKEWYTDKKENEIFLKYKEIPERSSCKVGPSRSSCMVKYLRISSYIMQPFLIYDFATAPFWISLYMRKILFSFFISVGKRFGCVFLTGLGGGGGWSQFRRRDQERGFLFILLLQHDLGCSSEKTR